MPMMPLFHLQSPVPQLRDESQEREQALQRDADYSLDGPEWVEQRAEERR